jgi:hypothetical protein
MRAGRQQQIEHVLAGTKDHLDHRIAAAVAIVSARDDHGQFLVGRHEAFEQRGHREMARIVFGRLEDGDAASVVAAAAGLLHQRIAESGEGFGRRFGHGHELGRRDAGGGERLLLGQLVLDERQHAGRGMDAVSFAFELDERLGVDVLDVEGDDIAGVGQLAQLGRVMVVADDLMTGDLAGR